MNFHVEQIFFFYCPKSFKDAKTSETKILDEHKKKTEIKNQKTENRTQRHDAISHHFESVQYCH